MAEAKTDASENRADPNEKKHPITWERGIEVLKVLATVWVALIGTIVTMQFNERQHELNRIEAIAKMLPHLSASREERKVKPAPGEPPTSSGGDMSKDGAIWAVFRTANNKKMLRDLASLFPEDIYRVVSSIAAAGGLETDPDALTALEVSSEKLATRYSATRQELAARLFNQAVHLKQRKTGDASPLNIVDITDSEVEGTPMSDQTAALIASVNKLAELHLKESEKNQKVSTGHFQAKQLFKRARQMGISSSDKEVQVQVAQADIGLAKVYLKENHKKEAKTFLDEARKLQTLALKDDPAALKAAEDEINRLARDTADK